MMTVQSADGTTIAFDKSGKGPALILVGGALEHRAMDSETAQLAPRLSQHFTVFHYDRRGRGDSTDTQPYAVQREIEDIDALIAETVGSAFLFGISSGAALAMEAASTLGDKVKKLAMYEAPYNDDEAARQAWKAYRKRLTDLLAQGRRDDALALFMMLVGMPAEHLERARHHPMWPMWEAATLAKAMPQAEHRTLEGQTHEVAPHVLAPVLVEFFKG
jgi:pimeloyl-ACP methyl ester carboxylesterase